MNKNVVIINGIDRQEFSEFPEVWFKTDYGKFRIRFDPKSEGIIISQFGADGFQKSIVVLQIA